ncbi:hypothetical protein EXIGLDRAFT_682018, partial [Exidia glandulosa HHB12029]
MSSDFKFDSATSAARIVLEFVCKGASGCGVPGVESAANLLLGVVQQVKKVKENDSACKGLIDEISALSSTLKSTLEVIAPHSTSESASSARLGSSEELSVRINDLLVDLERVAKRAGGLKKSGRMRKWLLSSPNAELLGELALNVSKARERFAFRGQISIEMLILDVRAKLEREAEEARLARVREAEEARLARENEARERERVRQDQEWSDLLARLPHADASYSSNAQSRHHRPLEGTRVDLLNDLDKWATRDAAAEDHFPFYVLTGGAGTGKSTIAFEVAHRARERGHLGASFFFTRGAGDLSTTELIFPTLAWQLLSTVPALRTAATPILTSHLQRDRLQNLDIQAEDLYVGLLSLLAHDFPPLIIVIDAVDECTSSAQDLVRRVLFLMMDGLPRISCSVRVFITSRPEVHIEDALTSLTFQSMMQRFRLHEIPEAIVDADIEAYLSAALARFPPPAQSALFKAHSDIVIKLTAL